MLFQVSRRYHPLFSPYETGLKRQLRKSKRPSSEEGSKNNSVRAVPIVRFVPSETSVLSVKRTISNSVAFALDESPKSTLKGVFQKIRRAVQLSKSSRITERLVEPGYQKSSRQSRVLRLYPQLRSQRFQYLRSSVSRRLQFGVL